MKNRWVLLATYYTVSLVIVLSGGTFLVGCGEVIFAETVYVTNINDDAVSVMQTSDDTMIDTILVEDGSLGVAVKP